MTAVYWILPSFNFRPFVEARALHHGLNMADEIGNVHMIRVPLATKQSLYILIGTCNTPSKSHLHIVHKCSLRLEGR